MTSLDFYQVHKAGSTTVSNLLARYALRHDLNVALPDRTVGTHAFHCFGHFHEDRVMPLAEGQRYNVLFNHMVYNRTALDNVMPSDTFYVAIMRQPQEMFLSAIYYYKKIKPPAANNTKNDKLARFFSKRLNGFRWCNSIVFDTGLPLILHANKTAVVQHVENLDRELDLMMVLEHFHESLVLLKRRVCLSLRDIVFLKTNSRRNSNVHKVTARDVEELKSWQMADHVAYDHFYAKFWAEVGNEGEGFYREVAHFKETVRLINDYCSREGSQGASYVVARSEWSEEFSLNPRDCELMVLREIQFQKLLFHRALRRGARCGYQEKKEFIPEWTTTFC